MEMSLIQVMVFTQSLIVKVRNPNMELTRTAVGFRNAYKNARGLNRNANALVVLRDLKSVCEENEPFLEYFNRAISSHPDVRVQL
jgi:hypothetical protein